MGSKLIVVLGPTASGKSDLAVKIARQVNGEIISADSRQVYKGLDIGAGKVKRDRRNTTGEGRRTTYVSSGIPHHLIDVASPRSTFTVARYQKLARRAVRDIVRRGRTPIIAGGTGHYIDSVLYDQDFPPVPPNAKLRRSLEKRTAEELFALLRARDPSRARDIDPRNKRRLVRALEIIEAAGKVPSLGPKRHSEFLRKLGINEKDVLKIGIALPPAKLRANIHKRLLARMRQGMVAEVKRLHEKEGVSWKRLDDLGLEYRYVSRYLRRASDGRRTTDDGSEKQNMLVGLETAIWRYSRRQMTWWRRDRSIKWLESSKELPL